MYCLAVIIALLQLANGAPSTETELITGGTPAIIKEVPYQVALLVNNRVICGGSILSPTVIVTAAHCTNKLEAKIMQVRAGSTKSISDGQLVDVTSTIEHPEYTSKLDNDISLVFLATELIFGPKVTLTSLPVQGSAHPVETSAVIAGWGRQYVGGNFSVYLKMLTVNVIDTERCNNMFSEFYGSKIAPVTSTMFCAGVETEPPQHTCLGDSGSGLVANGVIVGIDSWGEGCKHPHLPTVYTNIGSFRNWIDANM